MAVNFQSSIIYGFNENYAAVSLPCYVIGETKPDSGTSIMMLGYQIDSGFPQSIPTPPTIDFGIVPALPTSISTNTYHTLTVIAFTGIATVESASYSFQPTVINTFRHVRDHVSGRQLSSSSTGMRPEHRVSHAPLSDVDSSGDQDTRDCVLTLVHEEGDRDLQYLLFQPVNLNADNSPFDNSKPPKQTGQMWTPTVGTVKTYRRGVTSVTEKLSRNKGVTGDWYARLLVWDKTKIPALGGDMTEIVISHSIYWS
jgi:hypothetical protein